MKKIIICLIITMFLCGCMQNDLIATYPQPSSQISASSKPKDTKNDLSSAFVTSNTSKTTSRNVSTPNKTSSVETVDTEILYSNELIRLENEYENSLYNARINYTNTEKEWMNKVGELQTALAREKTKNASEQIRIENQINSLTIERNRAYANAVANTGGQPNSYANSIKQKYDAQINNLRAQLGKLSNNVKEIEKQLEDAKASVRACEPAYNQLVAEIEQKYEDDLNKLNAKYGK